MQAAECIDPRSPMPFAHASGYVRTPLQQQQEHQQAAAVDPGDAVHAHVHVQAQIQAAADIDPRSPMPFAHPSGYQRTPLQMQADLDAEAKQRVEEEVAERPCSAPAATDAKVQPASTASPINLLNSFQDALAHDEVCCRLVCSSMPSSPPCTYFYHHLSPSLSPPIM
jgi:hypothetical protein